MSLKLKPEQWQEIVSFQSREMERLVGDRQFARVSSVLPHYSGIGRWLSETPGARILEVGCGPGRYVAMLSSLGYEVVGADRQAFPSWDLIRRERVTLQPDVSAEALPYAPESFDAVACMGALLYFNDARAALAEMHRVLKPGGRLVVRTVNRSNLFRLIRRRNIDPATVNLYTERELRALLEQSGFRVAETSSYGFYPPFFESQWWFLVNGRISLAAQQLISRLCPPAVRVNVNAFATRIP